MLLVKKITQRNFKALSSKTLWSALFIAIAFNVSAQDNSPYSRYGLGDAVPNNNIVNRSMGGVTAGYSNFLSINFNNPASYSNFQVFLEERSKKLLSGRVILDAGINFQSRTLRVPNQAEKFTANDAYFSYIQIGLPLRKNWGLSFGIRPLSRIGYKIDKQEQLFDPNTGSLIDSAFTEFTGSGGSFLPTIGTGFAIGNFSAGVNVGYLFGRRESATKRGLYNDTVSYNNSNHTTESSFGDIFFNAGLQYNIKFGSRTNLRLGASGNIEHKLNATQRILRETFVRDQASGDFQLDSVFEKKDIAGEIIYPASYTYGFMFDKNNAKGGGWSLGVDYSHTNWDDFKFFGTKDSVKNNWQIRVGTELRPQPGRNYLSNVRYRAGFFTGPDYITAGGELPVFGASFGIGLPLANYSPLSRNQATVINLGFEYIKRGNDDNKLRENMFRLSLGLNFSDIWFQKRKYD